MYSNDNYRTGWEQFTHQFTLLINQILLHLIIFYRPLFIGVSLSLLPAIVIGCSDSVPPENNLISQSKLISRIQISNLGSVSAGSTLDILIFNDDKLKRLDSYQRFEDFNDHIAHASSTDGEKIFFLYYGSNDDRYSWAQINSMNALGKISCNLEDEDRENPVMTARCRCTAGENSITAELKSLTCMIHLAELQCDFSGTADADATVTDVKAYLTNVNATSSIMPESSYNSIRMINTGRLNPDDLEGFKDRSIIMQKITDELGIELIRPEARFLCYPSHKDTGRSTKLVIEGKIEGHTYYWPIELGGNDGIARNTVYSYSILLRRRGTSDPDTIIDRGDMEVKVRVKPWEEKDNYYVGF